MRPRKVICGSLGVLRAEQAGSCACGLWRGMLMGPGKKMQESEKEMERGWDVSGEVLL